MFFRAWVAGFSAWYEENVSASQEKKAYLNWLKAYFTDTDHTSSNIISRDSQSALV
jgi:hypothetical protein